MNGHLATKVPPLQIKSADNRKTICPGTDIANRSRAVLAGNTENPHTLLVESKLAVF